MGVPSFWKIFEEFSSHDLPLANVLQETRNLRVVIDGEIWLEECFNTPGKPNQETQGSSPGKPRLFNMYAFISRLKPFVQSLSDMLIVFDGLWKPAFKNNRLLQSSNSKGSIDDYLKEYSDHTNKYHRSKNTKDPRFQCCDEHIMRRKERYRRVLLILEALDIAYVFACAESEVLCSHLQKAKRFDYTLSNDSDCLIYGATSILRNFKKSNSSVSESSEYYMSKIVIPQSDLAEDYLSHDRILLAGILMGGDYNQSGMSSLGAIKISKLLQDPSFDVVVDAFHEVFYTQRQSYDHLQRIFNDYIESNYKRLFGRNDIVQKYKQYEWPSEYVIMHYVKPLVFTEIPFTETTTTRNLDTIDTKKLKSQFGDVSDSWFHQTLHEFFILNRLEELKHDSDQLKTIFRINKENTEKYRVRFKSFVAGVVEPLSTSTVNEPVSPSKRSPSKIQLEIKEYPYYMWIEKSFIILYCPLLAELWKEYQLLNSPVKRPTSAKKRKLTISPQKTTLDAMGFFSNRTTPKLAHGAEETCYDDRTFPETSKVRRKLFINDSDSDFDEDGLLVHADSSNKISDLAQPKLNYPKQYEPPICSDKHFDFVKSVFSDSDSSDDLEARTPQKDHRKGVSDEEFDLSLQIIEPPVPILEEFEFDIEELSPMHVQNRFKIRPSEVIEISDSD